MMAMVKDDDKPPFQRIRRQRGPRAKSTDPGFRRDEAIAGLNDRRKTEILLGRRRVTQRVLRGLIATSDHLADIAVDEQRRSFVGAVFRGLHSAGVIRPVGWQASEVPRNHARPIVAWTLNDEAIARKWLADHPDLDPLAVPVQRELFTEITP